MTLIAENRATTRSYLTNATLILPDRTLHDGALVLEDGVIAAICPDSAHGIAQEIDLGGDIVMPGLIDLHGDAIEREMEPRDRARLPLPHAVVQGDRKCALAGITTMFHALSFAGEDRGVRTNTLMSELARLIHTRNPNLVVDNRIHCRYEITGAEAIDTIKALIDEGICGMVALNNHTPGQGQFRDLEVLRQYLKGNHNLSDAEIDQLLLDKAREAEGAEENARVMAEITLQAGVPLASHDDEDTEKVLHRHRQGTGITEFPLSLEAAQTATSLGMHSIVGAPNVMRGGSTGSGESALKLIGHEVANCICSDYAPSTLLPATFCVASQLDWPLHRAIRLVTANPALAAGLTDRGEIRTGLRADLIAVRKQDGIPAIQCLWSDGRLSLRFD